MSRLWVGVDLIRYACMVFGHCKFTEFKPDKHIELPFIFNFGFFLMLEILTLTVFILKIWCSGTIPYDLIG